MFRDLTTIYHTDYRDHYQDMEIANDIMKEAKEDVGDLIHPLDRQYAGLGMAEMTHRKPFDLYSSPYISDGASGTQIYRVPSTFRLPPKNTRLNPLLPIQSNSPHPLHPFSNNPNLPSRSSPSFASSVLAKATASANPPSPPSPKPTAAYSGTAPAPQTSAASSPKACVSHLPKLPSRATCLEKASIWPTYRANRPGTPRIILPAELGCCCYVRRNWGSRCWS